MRPTSCRLFTGRIEMICGPMFAGKSTELIRRLKRHTRAGKRVLVLKHAIDDRFHKSSIVNHDGGEAEALAVSTLRGIDLTGVDVVGIDEGQFFGGEELADFCRGAAGSGVVVIAAGLSGDFQQRAFPSMSALFPLVDEVSHICAVCDTCGSDAHFSCRVVAGGESQSQILVGGAESYRASCRACLPGGRRCTALGSSQPAERCRENK